jgi:hypothetical protein
MGLLAQTKQPAKRSIITSDTYKKTSIPNGRRIKAHDAIFIIKEDRSIHWGKYVTYSSKQSVWHTFNTLVVVTNLQVMKLSWANVAGKKAHDMIVSKVARRKIRSLVDLNSEISRFSNRYGIPVMLVRTKLEYFND